MAMGLNQSLMGYSIWRMEISRASALSPITTPRQTFLSIDYSMLRQITLLKTRQRSIGARCLDLAGSLVCSKNALYTVAVYNTHENFSLKQYGGTFQLTFGALAAWVVETGVDDCQLGRYT